METLKAISKRKSTRSFKPDRISEKQLDTILAAGCAAPVGMRRYGDIHITVIQKKDVLEAISTGVGKLFQTENDMLYGVPTLVLLSAKENPIPGINDMNAGCILENMALAATDLGVESCIFGGPAPVVNSDAGIKETLGLPEGYAAVGSIGLGFAAEPNDSEKDLKVTISMNRI